jgi:hypothetical protein
MTAIGHTVRAREGLRLHVGQELVSVAWYKNRFTNGEWIPVVAPGDLLMPWEKSRVRNAVLCREELRWYLVISMHYYIRRPAYPMFGGTSTGSAVRVGRGCGRRMSCVGRNVIALHRLFACGCFGSMRDGWRSAGPIRLNSATTSHCYGR